MEKKQMQEFKKKYGNKDTLIKIFIEALEANPILEKFMSIEQIKNKLNSVIYSVEFISDYSSIINIDNVNKSTLASWDTKNGIILFYDKNIDINNDTEIKMTIIHELFHALSTSHAEYISLNPSTKAELKCGVRFAKFFSFLNENKEDQSWNDGLNEGITQWLTEMVMEQYSFKCAYRTETDYIFPKLCNIIDIDEILRLYFEDIKNIDPNAQKELFKNYLITKFGTIGTSISNQVTKILELTDFVTNYSKQDKLNEDSKKCKQKSLTEIDNSFSKIFSIIIENEHDLLMKIKKIGEYKKLTTGSTVIEEAKKILENISKSETNESNIIGILNELVNIGIKNVTTNFLLESNISDEKKFELLKEWNFNSTLFEKIAKCNFIASMPASDQLEFFLKNNLDDKIEDNNAADTIYQLCVKDNIIVDQVFKKIFYLIIIIKIKFQLTLKI